MPDTLDEIRHEAADREFENYEFGEARVGEADGWGYDTPGTEYSRTIWFENPEDPNGPDLKGHFAVRFAATDSAEVSEAYASLNGQDVGRRPSASPGPG
jgi:hypothetical protein